MSDSQIKSNYSPPQQCQNGCARWDNLAADGNTRSQSEVNAKWTGGSPPQGAGNMCAQPANDSSDGPWCYCKGTNDSSWGYCQIDSGTTNQNDRNLKASVCKSTPNGLNTLNSEIDTCTSTTELNRNTNFAGNTVKLQQDISSLSSSVMDSLTMGDTMFGQFGYNDIAKQVKVRNEELKSKKETLIENVEKNEAIIERSNRDFSDVKDTVPEPMPKKTLHFIEDWTLAILSISYLFMIIAVIYVYTSISENKLVAFFQSLVGSTLLSLFLFMVLFYLI